MDLSSGKSILKTKLISITFEFRGLSKYDSPMSLYEGPERRAFDRLTRVPENINLEIEAEIPQEKLKDYIFNEFVKQALVEDFFDSLGDFLDDEELDLFQREMVKYSDEEIISALALPHELRERNFEKFEAEIRDGVPVEDVVKSYVEKTAARKFTIGFHTSPYDIRPDEETNQWTIRGTEKDHRDADRLMAYYSTQYRHLFKKTGSRFIYVVRTEATNEKTDGTWSRQDSLSVIMRIPLQEAVSFVESTAKKEKAPDV